ncbi:hypothetical protein D3C73_1331010 [compost metagenome]
MIDLTNQRYQPSLKLGLGHSCMLLSIVAFTSLNGRKCSTWEVVDLAQQSAKHPFNMSTVARLFDRSELQIDTVGKTRLLKVVRTKVCAIINVNCSGDTPDRPRGVHLMKQKPVVFG